MSMRTLVIGTLAAAVALIVLGAIVSNARPTIDPTQLRFLGAPTGMSTANLRLVAFGPNGFYVVEPTSPVALSAGTNGSVLMNVAVPPAAVNYPSLDIAMARQADGSYVSVMAPGPMTLRVYRNGLLQYRDLSYAVDATPGRIVPMTPWSADDTVTCDLIPIG